VRGRAIIEKLSAHKARIDVQVARTSIQRRLRAPLFALLASAILCCSAVTRAVHSCCARSFVGASYDRVPVLDGHIGKMLLEPDDSFDYLFKIVLIGDMGVGKTCVVQRFKNGTFIERQGTTIGVDFTMKTLIIDGKRVKLQIWVRHAIPKYFLSFVRRLA
jgi:hypothetical protein